MATILVVDDEPQNLKLIQRYLSETDYHLLTANNGLEGWNVLTQHRDSIEVILLDRMMPGMDGIAFMEKLKQEDAFATIPVIMQTAAAEPSQVIEGLQAGVFYYLTKPYDEEILKAIIQAALLDRATHSALRDEVIKYKHFLGLVEQCTVRCQKLDEARDLAIFLANCFPDPDRVVLGISELLVNAIEHGNLGITYEEKTFHMQQGTWEAEIQRRSELAENINKRAYLHYEKNPTEARLTIIDQGEGFAWQDYLDINPSRAMDTHGRGIAMSRMISFDDIHYNDKGNQVTAVVRL